MKVKTKVKFDDGVVKIDAGTTLDIRSVGYGADSILITWCVGEQLIGGKFFPINNGSSFPIPADFINLFCFEVT